MALPEGLNRSRSAIVFLVNEDVAGTIETQTNGTPSGTAPPALPNASADAFGLVSVPTIGQQGNYSDTSEIGPELITTDRVLNYMEYSTFDLEYYAKPNGVVAANAKTSISPTNPGSALVVRLTGATGHFTNYAVGDTIRVGATGDANNADGLHIVTTKVSNDAIEYNAKKSGPSVSGSSATCEQVSFTLPTEDKILARCFGGRKFMSTASRGYASGKSNTSNVDSTNATCVSYFLQNTVQTLTVHSRQFTDDSMQMYTATGALPTSFSVTFAKDGAVTYSSGFQSNRVFYTGTAELNPAIGTVTSGSNFTVTVTGPKRFGKDSTVTASDIAFVQTIGGSFTAGSQVKIRAKSGATVAGSPISQDTDFGPFEVKAISGAVITLGGATAMGSGGISAGTVYLIPFMPDVALTTSVIDQRKVQVFLGDAVKDVTSSENLLDYNPVVADVADASVLASTQASTQDHLYNLVNSLEVTSVNFDFDRAITTPGLTEMSGESFPPASYIINEPSISGSLTLLLRPKDFQLMNSLREDPRRSIGVRVGDKEGKIIEMGAASAFFEVPSPADADGATQIDIPFTVIRGDLGETEDANKFFVRYR
jgi:hypothetical protein